MNWNPDEHYKNRQVADEYDRRRFSSAAGRVFNYLEKRAVTRCFASVSKDSTIVDAPCGTGRLAEPLLVAGYRVRGLDISDEMLDVAGQRLFRFGDRFTSEVRDVKTTRPAEPQFDAALCARVLMHFPLDQQIEFLSGVAALSRATVVINHSLDSGYQRLRRRLKHWLGHQPSVNHPVSNAQIKQLLQKSGLREVSRHRLVSLVSEAVYIVAEPLVAPAGRTRTAAASATATAL
jgi:2-polyprenyl-3-methyl-5-hydroxy-6-metoxy-1,4-benzoquinol methylase